MKGNTIAHLDGQVERVQDSFYLVKSQSGHGKYEVSLRGKEWGCTCPDHEFRDVKCKHIWAVEISKKIKDQVKNSIVIEEVSASSCIYCHSGDLKKYGVRKNKSGGIQRFLCQSCGKTFSVNIGFERMKHNPKAITSAMQLYFSGESLRNTQRSLKLLGV
jgi:transposase-like protein